MGGELVGAFTAAAEGSGQLVDFAQYGVLGLIVLAFIMGWIIPKPSHDALRADLDRREAQLQALISTYEKEVIPVLTEVNAKLLAMATDPASPRRPRA